METISINVLTDDELADRYDITAATVWRFAIQGAIPFPRQIAGKTRWLLDEVRAWEQRGGGPMLDEHVEPFDQVAPIDFRALELRRPIDTRDR